LPGPAFTALSAPAGLVHSRPVLSALVGVGVGLVVLGAYRGVRRRMRLRLDVWMPAATGVLALALAAGLLARPRAERPDTGLVGILVHDFGDVEIGEDVAAPSHVFVLHNTAGEPVRIEGVSSTCGCLDASVDRDVVPPDGELRVSATLQLAGSGTRQAEVILVTSRPQQPVVRLAIQGTGRTLRGLDALPQHFTLRPGESSILYLLARDFSSDDAPAAPEITAAPGFTLSFGGWKRIGPRLPERDLPACWDAVVDVVAEQPGRESGRRHVELTMPGVAPVAIGLELVDG
jgi:hypothetical protein